MAEDAESGDTLGSPFFGRSDRNPSTSETSNSDSMVSNNAEATDIHPTEGSGPGNEERAQVPAQTQSSPAPVAQSLSVGFAQLPPTPVGLARGQNPANPEGVRQSPPNLGPVAQSPPVGLAGSRNPPNPGGVRQSPPNVEPVAQYPPVGLAGGRNPPNPGGDEAVPTQR